jgi:hypothetical protein
VRDTRAYARAHVATEDEHVVVVVVATSLSQGDVTSTLVENLLGYVERRTRPDRDDVGRVADRRSASNEKQTETKIEHDKQQHCRRSTAEQRDADDARQEASVEREQHARRMNETESCTISP